MDEYESERPPRREQPDLVLSRQEREELLVEWGASFQEIIDAIRTSIKIKNQRRSTVNAIGRYDRWEEMMESAGRKIKRTMGLQRDNSPQQYVTMLPPPTHRPNQQQHRQSHRSQQPHPHGRPPSPEKNNNGNAVPKKPERRESAEQAASKSAADRVQREILDPSCSEHDRDDEDDERAPPSLIASSAVSDNSTNQIHEQPPVRPKLFEQVSGLSYDSRRPAELIEVDPAATDDADKSICSLQSGLTMSVNGGDGYSEAGETMSSDGFGRLERDTSYWMVGGMDAPRLLRCYNPTVINEDGNYDNMFPPAVESWQYQGFGLQPPPYSNSIINRWE